MNDKTICSIAAFIAARLRYDYPMCNGAGNPWVSTIYVEQHKEKFGEVRVYCTLAYPQLVKAKWDWMKANPELRKMLTLKHFAPDLTECEDPTSEFTARCRLHDAIHYRKVYMEMITLVPTHSGKVCNNADFGELLRHDISSLFDEIETDLSRTGWVEMLLERYKLDGLPELNAFMASVYKPKLSDVMEIRD